jgi:hypothetical protein
VTVFHYTCEHGRAALGDSGELMTGRMLNPRMPAWLWMSDLVWMTDLSVPIRDALGLTMRLTGCDRTRHRYVVTDATHVVPWTSVRRTVSHPEDVEDVPGARPAHWYVSRVPVPVLYAPNR